MADFSDLKERIAATFADVTEGLGAAVKQGPTSLWIAQSSPDHVVELHLADTEGGFSVVLRSGSMKAELRDVVSDESSLLKAQNFIKMYAPKPLCSEFEPRPGTPKIETLASGPRLAGAPTALQLQGGGSTVEFLEPRFSFGFIPRPDGAESIIFAFYTAAGLKNVVLTPDAAGVYQPVRLPNAPSPDDLVRVTPGPIGTNFEIVDLNRRVAISFPKGCTLHSAKPGVAWSFELFLGRERDQGVLLLRGPFHGDAVPKLSQLTLPDQTVVASSTETDELLWIENEYLFDNLKFRQFHCYAELDFNSAGIVTAQALATQIDAARELAKSVARSARWMQKHENPSRAH